MWDTLIIQPFTNVLLAITMVVKNFGVAIILFTLLIKLITYPLTAKQLKQTAAMQTLQSDPRYKKMMEKYRDNKEKLAEEQMKLYKETGVSPFGSCLPTLIQFPIIIGLYQSIIKAMAATPLEILRLERLVYPFLDATKILPIQNRFLWMDLGQPERLPILGSNSYLENYCCSHNLAADQGDDSSKHRRRGSSCRDDQEHEPLYAYPDGLDGLLLGFRLGAVFPG